MCPVSLCLRQPQAKEMLRQVDLLELLGSEPRHYILDLSHTVWLNASGTGTV